MTYTDIVFMQDEAASEAMSILSTGGNDALFNHLVQWDNKDGGGFSRKESPAGTADTTVPYDGYELYYNTRVGYCGLCAVDND